MSLLDDIAKFGWGPGIAVGIASIVVAPVLLPVLGSAVKPVAKGAIKGGILLYHKSRTAAAEAIETLEDLAAEAKAELAQSGE